MTVPSGAASPLLPTERDGDDGGSLPAGGLLVRGSPVFWRAVRLLSGIVTACAASICLAGLYSIRYPVVLSHTCIAFTLGLRHAVDCDHLAAIDNVTRQLLVKGQQPVSVGFWFALGHSTVVLMLTAVLAGGYAWAESMANEGNGVSDEVSLGAGLVSCALLACIGLLNLYVAVGIFRDWSRLQGQDERAQDKQATMEGEQALRTALTMIPGVKWVFEHVNRPSNMYGVGFLFGLSFDSATQVGLIGLAAMTGASGRVPPAVVMLFPVAFSCGMCLVDAANGLLMLATYSYNSFRPAQKLFYNFVVTSISAGIALFICSLEMLQIVAKQADWTGPFWTWVQNVDMAQVGYSIVASFILIFGIAVCYSQGRCFCRRNVAVAHEVAP